MNKIIINKRQISANKPTYIIAEMSANHNKDFDKAVKILEEAKKAGADAVKLQTYTPDTITIDCDNDYFKIKGTLWKGKNLYQLYKEAYTPWEWHPKLKKIADTLKLDFFSTPFDASAVDFLEKLDLPAYKIASFELVDIPLLRKVASTGKPVIMSTGMASLDEIKDAVNALKKGSCRDIALLKCTSAYPAPPEEANLKTITHLAETFHVPIGLSDHTLGSTVAITSIALGACIIEKHFCLDKKDAGPDSSFSMEPDEFKNMIIEIRTAEKALGKISYALTENQKKTKAFRRSLFAVEKIKKDETITDKNVRSIRPNDGLPPKYLEMILGKKAKKDISKGSPLTWDAIRSSE
ncbi:MAG: pseudaminic acid synthase [Desulfobacula sp.]|nr:pseudaminic acid synthase [Desulfobacula sp.]